MRSNTINFINIIKLAIINYYPKFGLGLFTMYEKLWESFKLAFSILKKDILNLTIKLLDIWSYYFK